MTEGFTCTADACCWHPAPSANGICAQHHRQARLAQMWHSPSPAVRAAAWLLTQPHQTSPGADGASSGAKGHPGPLHVRPSRAERTSP
jgi:hypothetical protein